MMEKPLSWRLNSANQDFKDVDTAILLKLYEQVSKPASKVPVSSFIDALPDADRAGFYDKFVMALRAGIFDGKGLEFLYRGKWTPLDGNSFEIIIEWISDEAIIREAYVLRTALPLQSLLSWTSNFGISLPHRFQADVGLTTAPLSDEKSDRPPEKNITQVSRSGRRPNVEAEQFWAEIWKLVDEGVQADPRVEGQTINRLADVMEEWSSRNMQKPYKRSTIERYIQAHWADLQKRSRHAIK